jgi:4-hydroxy-4-methyl-2-oxoglutarate aldolase
MFDKDGSITMPPRPNPKQIETLKRLGSATIHEAQGQIGALDSCLKPLDPTRRLAGVVLTVDCRPDDNLVIHYALTKAVPGDVLVVDAKAFTEGGPWGDILTLAAQKRGIAGLVIDGAVRDADSIIEMGFPVFARSLSIKGTLKNQPGRVGTDIVCGGRLVRSGDVIVGDRDGLTVIAAAELDAVIAAAEERERKEQVIRERIQSGELTVDILGLRTTLQRFGMA